MAKIDLNDVKGGFNLSRINSNFNKIEQALNEKVLYRDNPEGEANQMLSPLDMNGQRVYNLPEPVLNHEPARKADILDIQNAIGSRRTIRVNDFDIPPLPDALERRNKLLSFDDQGFPTVQFSSNDSATKLRQDLASSSGSSLVYWDRGVVGVYPKSLEANLRTQTTYISEFLSQDEIVDALSGSPEMDHTDSIQKAINSGYKRVISDRGYIYRITDSLVINTSNFELDLNKSTLHLDDPSGVKSHIIIGDDEAQKNGNEIWNITFTREQAAVAGAAIDLKFVGVTLIKGNHIYGDSKIYRGISVNRGIITDILDNRINNPVEKGIYLAGAGTGINLTTDTTINGNRVEGGVNALSTWDYVEGLFCRYNIFFNTKSSAVVVNASNTETGKVSFKFQENDFDTTLGNGLFIDNVSNVKISGNWFGNNATTGLVLGSGTDGVIVSGNDFYPAQDAMHIGGNSALVSSNLVSGGVNCIVLEATASHSSVVNNIFSNASIAIFDGTSVSSSIQGNKSFNMSSGTISGNHSSSTEIKDNPGDSSVGGTGFITTLPSPFTYTSGPRPEFIALTSGTVSSVMVGGNPVAFSSNCTVMLPPNKSVVVTYSEAPFMVKTQL